jgi:hypothetical protein
MGKHVSEVQKIVFLTHLNYLNISKAAKLVGLEYETARCIKNCAGDLEIEYATKGLPPPTIEQQVLRKIGSGTKLKITVDDLNVIFQECTLNRKQLKKLQYVVTLELGFNVCQRTIET